MNNINDYPIENDELVFADELGKPEVKYYSGFWKVMIVDDDPEIHNVTALVLDDLEFNDKKLKLFSCYTSQEAKDLLQNEYDIALILLDVVMEEENSGLKFIEYVRNEIKNTEVRIILRTGYPGQAPERKIVIDYDINDYKEKTELSSQKLITAVISALRAYKDIKIISDLNRNLEEKVKERTLELEQANFNLENSLELIKKDLNAGRKIQFKLLPERLKFIQNYQFSRYLFPSLYLSGDFVDYFEIDSNKIGFYLADVSGHGAASAFITVMLKSFFDNALRDYIENNEKTIINPSEILTKLNREILNEGFEKFLTIFYGIIDTENKQLLYINAGQYPYPVIVTKKEKIILSSDTSPVGMFKFTKYENKELLLPDEFSLFVVSDGLFEIINKNSMIEKQEYYESLLTEKDISINFLIDELKIEEQENIPDDITLLMIRKMEYNGRL